MRSLVKGYHSFEDVPVAEFMYLVFTRMQVRVTVGSSGLCCVRVTSFRHELTPLFIGFCHDQIV